VEMERHATSTDEKLFYRELGETFRRLRIGHSLTQEDVARSLGLTRTSVTNIEKGNQKILVHTLIAAADVFGVEPAELLNAPKISVSISAANDVPQNVKTWIEGIITGANPP